MYIRVAHDGSINPSFDQSDPLIDNIFFEFSGVQASSSQPVIQEETGDFGRVTIELSVTVICAEGFNGSDCNTFCEEIEGVLTCREVIVEATTNTATTATTATSDEDESPTGQDLLTVLPMVVRDNTVAIAIGASVAGAIVLFLVVGVILGAILLSRRVKSGTMSK